MEKSQKEKEDMEGARKTRICKGGGKREIYRGTESHPGAIVFDEMLS